MSINWTEDLDPTSAFFDSHRAMFESLPDGARGLDLACGRGRHSVACADLGLQMLCVDRNSEALADLGRYRPAGKGRIETRVINLEPPESQAVEAIAEAPFDFVLVFRYLHRPLMSWIADLLAPGGFLLYETFTVAQRDLGWGPSRDDFLLKRDELPTLFPQLEIEVFEQGLTREHRPAETARLRARRRNEPKS